MDGRDMQPGDVGILQNLENTRIARFNGEMATIRSRLSKGDFVNHNGRMARILENGLEVTLVRDYEIYLGICYRHIRPVDDPDAEVHDEEDEKLTV